ALRHRTLRPRPCASVTQVRSIGSQGGKRICSIRKDSVSLTGKVIGGVTTVGLPSHVPVFTDAPMLARERPFLAATAGDRPWGSGRRGSRAARRWCGRVFQAFISE